MSKPDTRAFDITIEIAVSPDAVWQALTSAEELVRWFPLEAEITPGPGGRWRISWEGQWPWATEIEIWEPNRHLRLLDRSGRPYDAEGKTQLDVAPMPIAIDWYLEAKGGSTILRLVHSGFGSGAGWDDEFEGVSLGWLLELNGLKHYLEHHRGRTRRISWNRKVTDVPAASAWARLVSPTGLLPDASLISSAPGTRYSTTLSTGDRIEGVVIASVPGRGFQVTVEGWNQALFRLWIDRVGAQTSVNSWLSTYDVPERLVQDVDARMRAEVNRLAGEGAVPSPAHGS